jgi:predicted esterase
VPREGVGERLLVLLHGYGLPSSDLTDRLSQLDPFGRCTVAVPTAPFEHKGTNIWHRALSTSAEAAAQQYQESLHLLDELLGALESTTGLASDEAIVGGFSQGGGLGYGLLVAADLEHRPAAAFGICSFPPAFGGFRVDLAAAAGRRCFLASAHRDHFAPIEGSRAGACRLRDAGLDLTYVELDTEHEMTDEAATAAGHWIDAVVGAQPVGGFDDALDRVGTGAGFYDGLWVETSSSPG